MSLIDARLRRFIQYALIGGVGTLVHYTMLVLLVSAAGADATLATTLGACAGAIINFVLNARYNFKTERYWYAAFNFFIVASLGVLVNSVAMYTLTNKAGLNYIISQFLCTGLVLIFTFVLNSVWTFRPR